MVHDSSVKDLSLNILTVLWRTLRVFIFKSEHVSLTPSIELCIGGINKIEMNIMFQDWRILYLPTYFYTHIH